MEIFEAAIFLALLAGLLSVVLILAAKKFAVKEDPVAKAIEEILPQYNCGACGFPGCAGFAKHLAATRDPDAVCTPGGPDLQKKIAAVLGVEVKETRPMVAHIFCRGSNSKAAAEGEYLGIQDCVAADLVNAATKECPYGCLGMGSCVRACSFEAIAIQDGLAEIIEEKCVACGKCVPACPRNLITIIPKGPKVVVECHSKDKGAPVKKYCQVGCISCMLCAKKCPENAISLKDNNVVIDHDLCTLCGTCIEVCPQKSILAIAFVPEKVPETAEDQG